jgi:hypothetical protein
MVCHKKGNICVNSFVTIWSHLQIVEMNPSASSRIKITFDSFRSKLHFHVIVFWPVYSAFLLYVQH